MGLLGLSGVGNGTPLYSTNANLVLWLKADSLSLNDNDPVATWTDSSINGKDATQATGGLRPVYKTNILNGKPVVRFSGTQYLDNAVFAYNQPVTIFLVHKLTTASTNASVFSRSAGGTENTIYYQTSGNNLTLYAGVNLATGINGLGTWLVTSAIVNTTSSAIRTGTVQRAAGNAGSSNMANYRLGNNTSGNTLIGDIAEVIVFNRALNTAEVQDIESALTTKYGL